MLDLSKSVSSTEKFFWFIHTYQYVEVTPEILLPIDSCILILANVFISSIYNFCSYRDL